MKNILFLTDLDGTLLNDNKEVGKNSETILNFLLKKGLLLGICSARTPATMRVILKNLNIKLPLCAMNGAAVYDMQKDIFTDYRTIDPKTAEAVNKCCKASGIYPFIHIIKNKSLYVYYEDLGSSAAREFYEERKNLKGKTYIKAPYKRDPGDTVYFTILAEEEKTLSLLHKIKNTEYAEKLNFNHYSDIYNKGFNFLEICRKDASKEESLLYLKALSGADSVYAFGDNYNDIPMLKAADKGFAVDNAPKDVKKCCWETIGDNNSDSVALKIKEVCEIEGII